MSEKDRDVDPVVPGVVNSLAGQIGPRHITPWDRMITVGLLLLLLLNVLFSIAGFTLTQLHNSCQNTSTQRLRDANKSDRVAQDRLDAQYQQFIDSLMGAPTDPQTRRRIYQQEKNSYANFKQIRAQNEFIRARTTRRC